MFDHLAHHANREARKIHSHKKHRRRKVIRHSVHALSGTLILTGVLLGVAGYVIRTTPASSAVSPQVEVRGISRLEDRTVVASQSVIPLHEFEFVVQNQPVYLHTVNFLLDGVYDPRQIRGITLHINSAQAGEPVLPDNFGNVTFSLGAVSLQPGIYKFAFRLETQHINSASIFRVTVDPATSLSVRRGEDIEFIPFGMIGNSYIINTVPHGTVNAFLKTATNQKTGAVHVYMYSEAEDARVTRFNFSASEDLTGTRLDVFLEGKFIGSAPFGGHDASIAFDSHILRILQGKNTTVTLLSSPTTASDITLADIEVAGFQSQEQWTEPFGLLLQ